MGLFLFRGQASIPILLLTEADWFVVSAVVFESAEEFPKIFAGTTPTWTPTPTLPLLTILRGGALPLRSVLAKLPFAEPGSFIVGCRQWLGLIGNKSGLLSDVSLSLFDCKFLVFSCYFFLFKRPGWPYKAGLESIAGSPYVCKFPIILPFWASEIVLREFARNGCWMNERCTSPSSLQSA